MIVRDIMTTRLITVAPDDTLAHAASLFRQYGFHHLPVARSVNLSASEQAQEQERRRTALMLQGVLTSQDINLAAAIDRRDEASAEMWQERRVVEVMHRALIRVTPTMSVAAAAQILVERGLDYLPVVEYSQAEQENRAILVGLITRSDLLNALARAMGAFEPGMQLDIDLPGGDMNPLTRTLLLAAELHVPIRSIIAAPIASEGVPHSATLRLGTIYPTPLLMRLQREGIRYIFGTLQQEGEPMSGGE